MEKEIKRALSALGDSIAEFKASAESREIEHTERLARLETALARTRRTEPGAGTAMSPETKALIGYARSGQDHELKALSVAFDPDGGYLVPEDFQGRVVSRLFETSPMRAASRVMTTGRDAVEFLLDKDEAAAEWVSEGAARGETATPALNVIRIPVHELHGQPRATTKLLDDADIDVESYLAQKVADRFARTESAAFVAGSGTGQPRGFLNYPAAAEADEVRAWGVIEYVPSGAAGGFPGLASGADDPDALFNAVAAMKSGYRAGASWAMNRATANVVRKLKDADGRYLWTSGLADGQPNQLLGYPVIEIEDMPDMAAESFSVAFANFTEAYTIVDRTGLRVLRDPFTAKPHVLFDFTKRVGGDVVNFEAIKLVKFATS